MRIVIIGAGVGGLASAVGLRARGHDVQVYEGADQLRTGGNGMILWPNGTGILADFGVDMTGLGRRLDRSVQRLQDGTLLAEADWTELSEYYGSPVTLVRRGRLIERLAATLPDGTVQFGKSCTSVRMRGTGASAVAVATFADGTSVEADVLIGADGHRSVVRRHLFGDHPAGYTGWATWHGVTELPVELTKGNEVNAFGGAAGWVALHPVGENLLFWAFETLWKDGELLPPGPLEGEAPLGPDGKPSAAENLRARFADWPEPIPELLTMIEDEDVSLFPHVMHRVPKDWARGRIVLVGDAAHVVPPRVAQGVNQALEDAWVLSRVLSGQGDPAAQLQRYTKARKPRMWALWTVARMTEDDRGAKILRFLIKTCRQASPKAQKRNFRYFSNYLSVKSKVIRGKAG